MIWTENLRNTNKNDLSDRRTAATGAMTARLQAFQAARKAAEPNLEARQKERVALEESRDARQALRDQAKREEQARQEDELREREAATAAAATAVADLRDKADNSRVARVIEDEAARKADRDRRYADRKARKA